jgi:formate-dependent nitrite reductase membrane component NrfD
MPANANHKSRIKNLVGFLSLVSSLLGLFSALMDLVDVREKGAVLVSLAVQTAFYTGNIAVNIFTSTFGCIILSLIVSMIFSAMFSSGQKPAGNPTDPPDWLFIVAVVFGVGLGIYRGFYEPPPWGRIITILVGIGILALLLYLAFKQYLRLSEGDNDDKSGSTT